MDRITSMTIFTTVVASGSFAAAAQRLNKSPASITMHVQDLEHRLGARLLNRTTRKLSLTEPGRAYFDRAARILAEIEETERSITELQSTPRGTLRINAPSALSKVLAPLFNAFGVAVPEITLDLLNSDRMSNLVEESIDVAVGFGLEPLPNLMLRKTRVFPPHLLRFALLPGKTRHVA